MPERELIERVESGSGPDRKLEMELVERFFGSKEADIHDRYDVSGYRLTSSLDAALAFAEKLLPGAEYCITNLYGTAMADIPLNGPATQCARRLDGDVIRALLAATLHAAAAHVPDEGEGRHG